MSLLLDSFLGIITGSSVTTGSFLFFKNKVVKNSSLLIQEDRARLAEVEMEVLKDLPTPTAFISQSELAELTLHVTQATTLLEEERQSLTKAELLLDKARKEVETKEGEQQALKVSREEDDKELALILGRFDQVQGECRALEENLANSLTRLEEILSEMELTDEQQELLNHLSVSLDQSASLLSELSTEHRTIHQRLTTLKGQIQALEEEYTRLVEQQLSG